MRKFMVVVVMVAAVTAFMVAAAGTAYAGKACPDKSKNPDGTPPNCGHAPPAPPVEPPAGNCQRAQVVLLQDSKIVCLFLGENAQFATKEADCPDALVAVPVSPVVGACVFLPPAS